jgi:uncharacterized protein (TIGR03067 family)
MFALALGLFGTAGACRGADDAKAELKKLQGEWPVVTKEILGGDGLEVLEMKIVFDDDKMTFKMKDIVVEHGKPVGTKSRDGASYSVKLDPSATPKAADLTLLNGPNKGQVIPAIYHLDEDQLWLCLGQLGGITRPDDFVTRRMPGRTVYKCKRPKPPSKEALKEMKKLAGTWVGVSAEWGGKPQPEFLAKKIKYVISEEKILSNCNGSEATWKYELDPDAKPKAIKMVQMGGKEGDIPGQRCHGIYQLDGDELLICLDLESNPRPTAFETKPKTQLSLYKLKREKP